MKTFTKKELIKQLKDIRDQGWIASVKQGNDGGVGNTLEHLLGIEENNLPIPNASEWELKTQRKNSSSLLTLFHSEPSPRAVKFVPQVLLPKYGWRHQQAGEKYPETEMSFRMTINAKQRSDRGFKIIVDRVNEKICVSFDANAASSRHSEWLENVNSSIGLGELDPQPYWGFEDIYHKVGTKLLSCFFVLANSRKVEGKEYFQYEDIKILKSPSKDKLITALEEGVFYIDFDARTGHNHGTKFRIKRNHIPQIYSSVTNI